ncbi:MAG: Asp-tRNA(Asn)/Glu-tRNA(Gln) amidotransferase subunit GatC [Gemmatimonadaceae bacterium]|nr:Asp-tRNA(Asn)/Glu-tRNA(Gln) amidotransferase subunit GatC [Gemmatimonadaceae bacterium]
MSISESDVRHVATLARLGLSAARIPSLVEELNGILDHMDVLQRVELPVPHAGETAARAMPLRDDVPMPGVTEAARTAFAPAMRDGFFLVPRLDTHGAAGVPAPGAGVADAIDDPSPTS